MEKQKHISSGIYIVWLDIDDKIHSKSIGLHGSSALKLKFLHIDIREALLLKQLDLMMLTGSVSQPAVIQASSRKEAKSLYDSLPKRIPEKSSQGLIELF